MRTLTIGGIAHAPDGSGYYRFYLPFKWLGENSHHITGMAPPGQQPPLGPDEAADIDVLVLQRPAGRVGARQLERLVGHTRLVYETDDDMLQVDPWGLPHLYDEQMRESIRRCLRLVDMVTVSTPYLAEQVSPFNENVRVLPNHVKPGLLEMQRKRRDKLTIGWAGGTSHLGDMVTVQEPLRRVLDTNPDVEMHFMGFNYSPLVKRPYRWSPWEADVGKYYKQVDFDVAIAPLDDSPFNRSKSPIRALEMGALGIPIIAANLLPYSDYVIDGKTGYLVNGEREFEARLQELIHDGDAREELGAAAREQAASWTIDKGWRLWESAYEHVASGSDGRGGSDGGAEPEPAIGGRWQLTEHDEETD
jgi:glycosyltransferase involved in cell wall biosynthesis